MRLVDLTRTLDSNDYARLPDAAKSSSGVLVPQVQYFAPAEGGADVMCAIFGCQREHLPQSEGWGQEQVWFNSHIGTHVDAPLHYGSLCEGKPARTVEALRLDELFCDGLVLDMRGAARPGDGFTLAALQAALAANGGDVTPGSAIMLRTGQEVYDLSDPRWFTYPGMTREATLFLAELGAKVLGTDAVGWDRPFAVMRRAFHESGDATQIWDGHFAGRERESSSCNSS